MLETVQPFKVKTLSTVTSAKPFANTLCNGPLLNVKVILPCLWNRNTSLTLPLTNAHTLVPLCRCCAETPLVHLTLLFACGITWSNANKTTSQL